MEEIWVRSLVQEDSLEKGMATHSRFLAWRIPWTEERGGYRPRGCTELDMTEQLNNRSLILNLRNGHYPQAGYCDSTLVTLGVFAK